jgi:hypothetical protein
VTNIVTVAVPGPQGPAGPQGPSGLGGDITGSQYYAAIYKSATGLFTGSIYDSGSFTGIGATVSPHLDAPERLFVDAGDTDSYNLISGHGTINNYLQLNVKNFSSGATGSSDIVATADNGDETSYFIDMGVNSSGYNIPDGIGGSNDAYLYSTAQDLLIGNASAGKRVIIFNGSGPALDNARVYITPQGTVGINASDTSLSNPEALLVEPLVSGAAAPNDFNNLIVGRGTVNESYLQLNMINKGSGSAASADIVATNDTGDETSNYIDMGINSSGFNTPNAVGIADDAYLYSTGRHLHIGNASNYPIQFFVGGLDSDANRKLQLNANDRHEVTGSLTATEGFTGSLYGTASWALNTVTSSNILGGQNNYVALWSGSSNLTSSIIYQNGSLLGINNPAPSRALDVISLQSADYVSVASFIAPNNNIVGNTTQFYLGAQQAPGNSISWTFNYQGNNSAANRMGFEFNGYETPVLSMFRNGNSVFGGAIDNGFKHDVQGTGRYTNNLTVTGSIYVGNTIISSSSDIIIGEYNSIRGSFLPSSNYISFNGNVLTLQSSTTVKLTNGPGEFVIDGNTGFSRLGLPSSWNVVIGSLADTVVPSAKVTINSTDKGFLPTRTNSTASITSPAQGLLTYITASGDTEGLWQYRTGSGGWVQFLHNSSSIPASSVVGLNLSQIATGSVTASVSNTDISASFRLTSGSNTLLNVTKDGFVWIGNGAFTNQAYQLDVQGTGRFTGQLGLFSGMQFDGSGAEIVFTQLGYVVKGGLTNTVWRADNAIYIKASLTGNTDLTVNLSATRARGRIEVGNTDNSITNGYFSGNILELGTTFNNNASYHIRTVDPTTYPSSYQDLYIYGGVGSGGNYGDLFLQHNTSTKAGNVIIGGNTRVSSSILSITSTTQGFLPTRTNLTSNISNPAQGLITYLTGSTNEGLWYYDSGSVKGWTRFLNDTGSQSISGSLNVTQAVTASNLLVTNTITAQTLVVQTITSSVEFVTGSTQFGSLLTNTHQFTGSVTITGSLSVNGSPVILTNQTSSMSVASASLATTASYATNALSSSYSATASIAVSSSYSLTASYALNAGGAASAFPFTGSALITGSLGVTGSIAITGSLNVGNTNIEFQENTNVTSGTWRVVLSEPTASYKAAFFDYVMFSGSIARAGTVYSVWSASYAEYYENYTGDVGGSTSGVTLQAAISGSNIQLQATASNSTWTIRSLVRML